VAGALWRGPRAAGSPAKLFEQRTFRPRRSSAASNKRIEQDATR
jgi:hypothetical protein